MAKKTIVYSSKGGVGKTTTVANIARMYAEDGKRVLVIDTDHPAKGVTSLFGVSGDNLNLSHIIGGVNLPTHMVSDVRQVGKHGVHVIPSNIEDVENAIAALTMRKFDNLKSRKHPPEKVLATALTPFDGEYDHIIIDVRPTTEIIVVAAIQVADQVIIPVIPEPLAIGAVAGTIDIIDTFSDGNAVAGVVLATMVDERLTSHQEGLTELRKNYGTVPVIPRRSGQDAPKRLLDAYRAIAEEIK